MEPAQKQRDKYRHSLFAITQVNMSDKLLWVGSALSHVLPIDSLSMLRSSHCSGTPSPHSWTPAAWQDLVLTHWHPKESPYHRVTAQLWWEGTSGDLLIQPPAQAGSARAGCSGPCWHPSLSHQHTFGPPCCQGVHHPQGSSWCKD